MRSQPSDRVDVGTRGGRTLEPPGGKQSILTRTPHPAPACEALGGRAVVTSSGKMQEQKAREQHKTRKTPPIFL